MRNCEQLLGAYNEGTLDLSMVSEEELLMIQDKIFEISDSLNTLIS